MPTPLELVKRVQEIVKDEGLYRFIVPQLNESLQVIASSENPKILLPYLISGDTLSTTATTLSESVYVQEGNEYKFLAVSGSMASEPTVTLTSDSSIVYPILGYLDLWHLIWLPLDTTAVTGTLVTVTCTSSATWYVPLPSNFHRELFAAESVNQNYQSLNILQTWQKISELWAGRGSEVGEIKDVCASKIYSRLYFRPIPSSVDTIYIAYYKAPSTISLENTTAFLDIPEEHQYSTLCQHSAATILANNDQLQKAATCLQLYASGMQVLYSAISSQYERVPIKRDRTKVQYI